MVGGSSNQMQKGPVMSGAFLKSFHKQPLSIPVISMAGIYLM
jgi:hypothetical protein